MDPELTALDALGLQPAGGRPQPQDACPAAHHESSLFTLVVLYGGCARVTAGPKRPHLGVCPGHTIPLQGKQGSRGCIHENDEAERMVEILNNF